MNATQLEGRCEIEGHPWEVAPFARAIHYYRLPIIRESDRVIVALCSRGQWKDVRQFSGAPQRRRRIK